LDNRQSPSSITNAFEVSPSLISGSLVSYAELERIKGDEVRFALNRVFQAFSGFSCPHGSAFTQYSLSTLFAISKEML